MSSNSRIMASLARSSVARACAVPLGKIDNFSILVRSNTPEISTEFLTTTSSRPGAGEAVNKSHQLKKLDLASLKSFRDRFDMPFTDEELVKVPFYRPAETSQ